jgi:hypothetical protein
MIAESAGARNAKTYRAIENAQIRMAEVKSPN